MKLLSYIAARAEQPLWKFSLLPVFAGLVMAVVFLFYPSAAMCTSYREIGPPSLFSTSLMFCEFRYWFSAGSAILAIAYLLMLNLLVTLLED